MEFLGKHHTVTENNEQAEDWENKLKKQLDDLRAGTNIPYWYDRKIGRVPPKKLSIKFERDVKSPTRIECWASFYSDL